MTVSLEGHPTPWTDEEYLALGQTPERVELLDGSLLLTPSATPDHQTISSELYVALRRAARVVGLRVLEAPNVRLRPGRMPIPDLVIARVTDGSAPVVPAADVRLVCEITSPSTASIDRTLKMNYYASAGIPWYLIVESKTLTLHLHRLADGAYVPHSVTARGEVLHLTEPVEATIRPEDLLP